MRGFAERVGAYKLEQVAKTLITGAAGFIGSNLVRGLLAEGATVRGVDNFATGRRENLEGIAGEFELVEADINDMAAMAAACKGVEVVFHIAAIPSVQRSIEDPLRSHAANVQGTYSVLEAARRAGVRRVVYAASSSAYGDSVTLPKHEGMQTSPKSPYAAQKLAGEHACTAYGRTYGLETVALRYFNVFGPRQDPRSAYSGVLSRFITQMLKGERPIIFGDGETSRDFTYIENVVQANVLAARAAAGKAAGRVFNVATGERTTLREACRLVAELTGYKGEPEYGPARKGDIQHSLADVTAARSGLGYEVKVGFAEGLRRTVEWYRSSQLR